MSDLPARPDLAVTRASGQAIRPDVDVDARSCEFPDMGPDGCPHEVTYTGAGRPGKYCGQGVDMTVQTRDGGREIRPVEHDAYNAYRIRNDQPPTAYKPGGPPPSAAAVPRPVSTARVDLDATRNQVLTTVASLEQLIVRFRDAMSTATDPDQVGIEVDAVHRETRRAIDDLEADRDRADSRRHAAETTARAAMAAQAEAETAARVAFEEASAAEERTTEARARADEADRVRVTADDRAAESAQQLTTLRGRLDELTARRDREAAAAVATEQRLAADVAAARAETGTVREQLTAAVARAREALATSRVETAFAAAARDRLDTDLTAARADAEAQRDRAEQALRATAAVEATTAAQASQLTEATLRVEALTDDVTRLREQDAAARAEIAAARAALAEMRRFYEAQVPDRDSAPDPPATAKQPPTAAAPLPPPPGALGASASPRPRRSRTAPPVDPGADPSPSS